MTKYWRPSFLFFIILSLMVTLVSTGPSYSASDEVNRFKLLEDKIKTEEELRPLGHDFLVDVAAALSQELLDIVDEAEKAGKTTGTDTQKIAAISAFLRKYDKTEQFGRLKAGLGVSLPSFTAWGTKIITDVRAHGDLGAIITIKTKSLFGSNISLDDIPGIPTEIKTLLKGFTIPATLPPGTDLVQYAIDKGIIPAILVQSHLGKYIMPDITLPNINLYAKNDFRYGLHFKWVAPENFFGHFFLYDLLRTDKEIRISEQILKKDQKITGLKDKNTQSVLALDLSLGYKVGQYALLVQMEDIKLKLLSERITTMGDVAYLYDPIYRAHATADFQWWILRITPFLGVHSRDGYDIADSWYTGAEGGLTFWSDRFQFQLRGMIDKEYLVITPRIRLWIVQAEYSFRSARSDTTPDGMKSSNIHSANLRIFF